MLIQQVHFLLALLPFLNLFSLSFSHFQPLKFRNLHTPYPTETIENEKVQFFKDIYACNFLLPSFILFQKMFSAFMPFQSFKIIQNHLPLNHFYSSHFFQLLLPPLSFQFFSRRSSTHNAYAISVCTNLWIIGCFFDTFWPHLSKFFRLFSHKLNQHKSCMY